MTKMMISLCATLALAACGDNKQRPDAAPRRDSLSIDAMCSDCPPAPALGTTLLDRMGRPAINTALTHPFDSSATAANAAKDAYNANMNEATWVATYGTEIRANLGIFDALDAGVCGNGLCENGENTGSCAADCPTGSGTGLGCGNQLLFQAPTSATSYGSLANILAADALYLDTSRGACTHYLAVEIGVALNTPHSTCGGRTPQYDVIDYTYAALAMGPAGFASDAQRSPKFNCDALDMHCGDDVGPHTDYLSAFPYLGDPH